MNFPHLFENDFYAILPELYLTLSTLVLLLFGVFYSTSKKTPESQYDANRCLVGSFLFILYFLSFAKFTVFLDDFFLRDAYYGSFKFFF